MTASSAAPTFAGVTQDGSTPAEAVQVDDPASALALPRWSAAVGRGLLRALSTVQGVVAFALITLAVLLRKAGAAHRLIRPMIRREVDRSGLQLIPMFAFLAVALGLVVIGQTVSWLSRLGAIDFIGPVMVIAVVRELGPLVGALVILARVGTAHVVELGTARALGEIEVLESLGIDPVHYCVVPRVVGMMAGTFALTVYLILGAIVSGYAWVFLQDIPLRPEEYFRQIAVALRGMDFVLLGLKTLAFGFIMAIVTCFHGLARPIRVEQVSRATVRAVTQSVIACVVIDALFIVVYLTIG
ncbi:MAG: ABC transporter permease [Verrucomicrobia bacterium]|nr:ABC transporter permease [Verrucomicrobiota bacterium]